MTAFVILSYIVTFEMLLVLYTVGLKEVLFSEEYNPRIVHYWE